MAAGDEQIDVFDQVQIKNRLTDLCVEVKYGGRDYVWQPGEVRHIPRAYAEHFLKKGTYRWDPMEIEPPKRRLVLVGPDAEAGVDVSDLTRDEMEQFVDLIDDSHLPDRYFDPATGAPLRNKEFRGVASSGSDFRGRGPARRINASHPDMVAEGHAAIASVPVPEA
jgi:hypothetical protein